LPDQRKEVCKFVLEESYEVTLYILNYRVNHVNKLVRASLVEDLLVLLHELVYDRFSESVVDKRELYEFVSE
jgi:hypothetical protein